MTSKFWNAQQVKEFAKSIRKSDAGIAWGFLVPEIRHAVVEAKILSIIRGQERETVPMEAIDDLTTMLHTEMDTADFFGS